MHVCESKSERRRDSFKDYIKVSSKQPYFIKGNFSQLTPARTQQAGAISVPHSVVPLLFGGIVPLLLDP